MFVCSFCFSRQAHLSENYNHCVQLSQLKRIGTQHCLKIPLKSDSSEIAKNRKLNLAVSLISERRQRFMCIRSSVNTREALLTQNKRGVSHEQQQKMSILFFYLFKIPRYNTHNIHMGSLACKLGPGKCQRKTAIAYIALHLSPLAPSFSRHFR